MDDPIDKTTVEACGPAFSEDRLIAARAKTWHALHAIAERIKPGMHETQALRLANKTLAAMGAKRLWHPTQMRFGANTVKPFGVPSDGDPVLQENDIYFVDIGPLWDGYEGDAAKTFVVGEDPELRRCASDAEAIYAEVRRKWLMEASTGQALYRYAEQAAQARGWHLNLHEANGHRLANFPHHLHFSGAIADVAFRPATARWVLEIQIRHSSSLYGAFFEDLLLDADPT